jgi:monoamine oxidase
MRVTLRFRESFWESNNEISFAGFLLSDEQYFPTWWTSLAVHAPIITGWSAGPHADALLGQPTAKIVSTAVAALARITNSHLTQVNELLEAAYFHDWHADPFARGAYSYVPAGALEARNTLAQPVADTLYFAGEASELNGHSATVHGAIASGMRAARQILKIRG